MPLTPCPSGKRGNQYSGGAPDFKIIPTMKILHFYIMFAGIHRSRLFTGQFLPAA